MVGKWKIAALVLGVAIGTALALEPAWAQTTVDVRPAVSSFLEWAATAATAVLTVLGGVGIRLFTSRAGLANSELEASLVARLDDIIHKGIAFALTTAQNEVNKPGSGLAAVKVDNWFMSVALSYVNASAKDIIAKFGLTPDRIRDMIAARLQPYIAAGLPIAGGLPTPASIPTPSAAS